MGARSDMLSQIIICEQNEFPRRTITCTQSPCEELMTFHRVGSSLAFANTHKIQLLLK